MTMVSQELARIAQTINRGVSGLGTSRLAGEQQKTRGALLDYNLGRNRVEDARAAERFAAEQPVREVAGLQAQTDLDREASYDSEVQDPFAAYMRTQWLRGVAEHYGTEIDLSTGSPRLVFPDGSVLKEIQRDKQWEAAHILSKYKLSSTSKDQIARIEEKEQRLNAEGVPITDPAYGKLAGNKMKIQARLDNPEEMIQGLTNQIDQLERSGGHFPEAIKRIKGEIKNERSRLPTPTQKLAEARSKRLHAKQMKALDAKKGGDKLDPKVKQAQALVLKFVKGVNPMTAMMLMANPDTIKNPDIQDAIRSEIPEALRGSYNKAIEILDEFYGVEKESTKPKSSVTHEFIPGKGLVTVE